MSEHHLQSWPGEFQATWDGRKTFDLRSSVKGYELGDVLVLQEYDPDKNLYSGRTISALVMFVLPCGQLDLPRDLCVMSIRVFGKAEGLQGPECVECQREFVNGRCPRCGYSK